MRFYFKSAEPSDRSLIHTWLKQPHITEWFYGQGLQNTLDHLDQFLEGNSSSQYFIGYEKSHPFAFFITSKVSKPNDPLTKWCSKEGEAITLDLFIGDLHYLGKGLSTSLIGQFLFSTFGHVSEVLIDPESTNTRAIHVYQKVGFKKLGSFIPTHSPHLHDMMRLDMKKDLLPLFTAPSSQREGETITSTDFSKQSLQHHTFHHCIFDRCLFSETLLQNAKFCFCTFIGCNISLAKFETCRLQDVEFKDCKIVGGEFFKCEKTFFSLKFRNCLLHYCNFSDLTMKNTSFIGSKILETHFTNTNLQGADFSEVDFIETQFHNCDLCKANFSTATGYRIDPLTNKIKKAKFSLPEAASLLLGFDITLT